MALISFESSPTWAVTHVINVSFLGFSMPNLIIDPGDVVEWQYQGGGPHTITSGTPEQGPDGLWDGSIDAFHRTFSRTFDISGQFSYYCNNHGDTGIIQVSGTQCTITGPYAVCGNSTNVIFTAYPFPDDGVFFSWSLIGDGVIVGPTNAASISVTAGGAGSFVLYMNGLRYGQPFLATWIVFVNSLPGCVISGLNVLQSDTSAVYTATVYPGGGMVTYGWSITGNGQILGQTNQPSVFVMAGGEGSLNLTLDCIRYGCPGQCQKTVTVIAPATCAVSGQNGLVQAQISTYTGVVTPTGGSVTYSWTMSGNGSIFGSTTASTVTVVAGAPGDFTLGLQFIRNGWAGSCGKTVTVAVARIGVGEDVGHTLRLLPSPNPFSSQVDLHFDLDRDTRVALEIFDLQGRRIRTVLSAELPIGQHEAIWEGKDEQRRRVPPGIYFACLTTQGGRSQIVKLFKSR